MCQVALLRRQKDEVYEVAFVFRQMCRRWVLRCRRLKLVFVRFLDGGGAQKKKTLKTQSRKNLNTTLTTFLFTYQDS